MDDDDVFGSDEEECGGTVVAKPAAVAPAPAPVPAARDDNSDVLLSSDEEEECGGVVTAKPAAAAAPAPALTKEQPREKHVNIIDDSSSDSDIGARKKRRAKEKKRALRESDSEEEANAQLAKRKAEEPTRVDSEDEGDWEPPEWVGRVHQATQERIFYTQCMVAGQIVKQGDVVEVWNGAGKPGLVAKVMEMYVDRVNKQNMFDAQWLYTKNDVPAGVVIPHRMDCRELLETSHFDTNPLETIVKPISVKFLATTDTPRDEEIAPGAFFCRYKYDNITGDVMARFSSRNDRINAKSLETKSRGRNAAPIEDDPNKALDRLREKLKDDGKVKRKRRAMMSDGSDEEAPQAKKAKDGDESDDGAMDADLLGMDLDEVDADGTVVVKKADGDDTAKDDDGNDAKPKLSLRVRRRGNNDETDDAGGPRKGRGRKKTAKDEEEEEEDDDDDDDSEKPKKKRKSSKKSKKKSKKSSKKKSKRSRKHKRKDDSESESESESEPDDDSDGDSDSSDGRRRKKKPRKDSKKDSKKKRKSKPKSRRPSRPEQYSIDDWEEAQEAKKRTRRGPSFKPAFAVGGGESGRWSDEEAYEHDDFVVSDSEADESASEETSSSSSGSESTDESTRQVHNIRESLKTQNQRKKAVDAYKNRGANGSKGNNEDSGKDDDNATRSKRPSIKLKLGKKSEDAAAGSPEAAPAAAAGISDEDSFIVDDCSDGADEPVKKSRKQRRATEGDGPVQANILTSAIGAVNLSPEQSLLQYVQYIATSLLDKTFAKDISKDANENYFRPAKRKVESLLITSRESLVGSMVWKPHFMKAMQQLPELKIETTNTYTEEDRCQICRRSKHSVEQRVVLFGDRYDSAKLWASWSADRPYFSDSDEMEDDSDDELHDHKDDRGRYTFASGPACAERVQLYHALIHWKFDTVERVEKQIEKLQNANRHIDDAAIINNILDDKAFNDGIVRNTMGLIRAAETYGSKR